MTSLYAIMRAYHDAIEQALTDNNAALRRLGIDPDGTDTDEDAMPLAAMMTRED